MITQDLIEMPIGTCYDAIFDDRLWPGALDRLALIVGASACSFLTRGPPEARLGLPASTAYQAFLVDFVGEGWAQGDHRARRGWPRLAGGGVVLTEHDVSTEEERQTLPVYRDLYARHDLVWWSTISFLVEGNLWAMSFLRSADTGPFQRHDVSSLRLLGPHLARLMSLRSKFLQARATDTVGLLESNEVAACVVDREARIVAINGSAQAHLGIEIRDWCGRIEAQDRGVNEKLQKLIKGALRGGKLQDPSPVVIERFDRRPLLIDALSFPTLERSFQAYVLLLITDLDATEISNSERLQHIFGLTRAEAALARRLAAGNTLSEAADDLRIVKETGRSHLKSIYLKTNTNRQSELVQLFQVALHGKLR